MSRQQAILAAGWIALAAAGVATIVLPPSPVQVVLALAATLGLWLGGSERSILPAVLLVALALPYDRAANIQQWRVASIPVRPHDAVIGVGLLVALLRIRSLRPPAWSWAAVAFIALGILAGAYGLLAEDNAARDVLRDARWWFLWGGVLLALGEGLRPTATLRAILAGTAAFSMLVAASALLPAFEGGIRERAVAYDYGLLRLQFGNTAFLLVALAYAAMRLLVRPSAPMAGLLVLFAAAASMSLTRAFLLVIVAIVALVVVAALWRRRSVGWTRTSSGGRVASVGATLAAGLVIGVAITTAGSGGPGSTRTAPAPTSSVAPASSDDPVASPGSTSAPTEPGGAENPLERLLFQSGASGLNSLLGGRFVTYQRAAEIVSAKPVTGAGLGALVKAEYEFGGEEFGTSGMLPNVDNGLLTVGMKAGLPGMVAFAALLLAPLLARGRPRGRWWLVPAWLGLVALTMTQSFATTGYGPFVLGLLAASLAGSRGYVRRSTAVAVAQE